MTTIIPFPQRQAIDKSLTPPTSIYTEWKQLIPLERSQVLFAANLSSLAYSGSFNLLEILFGNDRVLQSSFLYGATFFYFDREGTVITSDFLLNAGTQAVHPLLVKSIPRHAVLMLVCTFNYDKRTNELLESLHAYGFEGYVVAQPGVSGNTTDYPQIQNFIQRNYFIAFRGSETLQDFLVEYIPGGQFTLALEDAVPASLRHTNLLYSNNAIKLLKAFEEQTQENPIYSSPFFPLCSFGNTNFVLDVAEILVTGHSLGAAEARCFVQLASQAYPFDIESTAFPGVNITGNSLSYRVVTFGCPPSQIYPLNRQLIVIPSLSTQGDLLGQPGVVDRHFVNGNDPVPNTDVPSIAFLDGLPRIRLFNETRGYYNIVLKNTNDDKLARKNRRIFNQVEHKQSDNNNSNNVDVTVISKLRKKKIYQHRIQKISRYNYVDIPLIALLSTEHPINSYITNIQDCDPEEFQKTIEQEYDFDAGIPYNLDRLAVLINVLNRFLPTGCTV